MSAYLAAMVALLSLALLASVVANLQLQRELKSYRTTYRTRHGWLNGYGWYHLASFDGGKHWFTTEHPSDAEVIITGPADPKMLTAIEDMDAFLDHVFSRGPFDLNDPQHVALMRKVGFGVRQQHC